MSQYDPLIDSAAARLGSVLRRQGYQVTAAESCTAGGICEAITRIGGSSAWFQATHGAVSEPVVRAMASGALQAAGADIAVAVSGVAGPDGGSLEKPVGTVWFAWAMGDGTVSTGCRRLQGNRREVRAQTVLHALEGLIKAAERLAVSQSST
jgi:nicotinamide-nucleotide amidase